MLRALEPGNCAWVSCMYKSHQRLKVLEINLPKKCRSLIHSITFHTQHFWSDLNDTGFFDRAKLFSWPRHWGGSCPELLYRCEQTCCSPWTGWKCFVAKCSEWRMDPFCYSYQQRVERLQWLCLGTECRYIKYCVRPTPSLERCPLWAGERPPLFLENPVHTPDQPQQLNIPDTGNLHTDKLRTQQAAFGKEWRHYLISWDRRWVKNSYRCGSRRSGQKDLNHHVCYRFYN